MINQRVYIDSIIERFRLTNARPITTPMEPGVVLVKEQRPESSKRSMGMDNIPYSEAIRSVLWAAMNYRPDIAYAVGVLAQFIQKPDNLHWEALKCIIVYLGSTKDLWLTFGGESPAAIEGFCDVDWASSTHCHSISGYSFHMGQGTVTWSSKKQQVIALSTMEAEYIALTHAVKEALWLSAFLSKIQAAPLGGVKVNCDNQGAIVLSKDNNFHARTKHIDI